VTEAGAPAGQAKLPPQTSASPGEQKSELTGAPPGAAPAAEGKDDARGKDSAGAKDDATGLGKDVQTDFHVVQRDTGAVRAAVTVRYKR
jgi:hypothetical protein